MDIENVDIVRVWEIRAYLEKMFLLADQYNDTFKHSLWPYPIPLRIDQYPRTILAI